MYFFHFLVTLHSLLFSPEDQLDGSTYEADGFSAYFSFCKVRSGYSGVLATLGVGEQPLAVITRNSVSPVSWFAGVVTFCHSMATPVAAEEGLTGQLSTHRRDAVHCRGEWAEFTDEEVLQNLSLSYDIVISWTPLKTRTLSYVPNTLY